MVLEGLKRQKKRIFNSVEYKIDDPKVWDKILKIANQAMKTDVLPQLGRRKSIVWSPLRVDATGSITLNTQDKLVLEIMKNPQLLAQTQQIVTDSIVEVGVNTDPQGFLQNALDSLKDDDGGN